mmetsp:Transcript_5626/g.10364  ORF Transcript_5626/g.10364 Transcript_5626/m.10364 type:complete len:322 (+) Transcript_5626:73-1038(+)
MSSNVPLSVLTCCALTFASLFQAISADAIITPMPTDAERKLLDAYEAAGGALNFVDLVCLSGVVMLALSFFERTGRAPTADDSASSADVLQELRIQSTAVGAQLFVGQTLAHWVGQISEFWRHPKKADNFQQQLLVQNGFAEQEAKKIIFKLQELEWSKGTFEMAAEELARVRQLYAAATSFFQAVAAQATGCVFTATFGELASGLEDACDSSEFIRGGINRWRQFSIRHRCVEWQNLYEQSPQSFYEMLMSKRLCKFETSIWLRELDKLQKRLQEFHPTDDKRLQEPVHEARESDSKLDPQGSLLQSDPDGYMASHGNLL